RSRVLIGAWGGGLVGRNGWMEVLERHLRKAGSYSSTHEQKGGELKFAVKKSIQPCCRRFGSSAPIALSFTLCPAGGFNPCCRGFGSSALRSLPSQPGARQVSILVVVDSAPRPASKWPRTWRGSCFNPCCRGFGSSALGFPWCTFVTLSSFNPCCRGF